MEKAEKLAELIDGAEELLTNLADAHNPQIQRLRDRVDQAVEEAKRAIDRGQDDDSVRLADVARHIDDYVREFPWLAVATGVLVAGSVAFVAGVTAGARKRSERETF